MIRSQTQQTPGAIFPGGLFNDQPWLADRRLPHPKEGRKGYTLASDLYFSILSFASCSACSYSFSATSGNILLRLE